MTGAQTIAFARPYIIHRRIHPGTTTTACNGAAAAAAVTGNTQS